MVPKGFLRYEVLKLLKENPMSGSEIMGIIEEKTGGYWRPSPGSIYPLLAWLQDKGYIREVAGEVGVKRYTLTDRGKAFLEEQVKAWEELRERFRHVRLGPDFMGPMGWLGPPPGKPIGLEKAMRDLAMALWSLHESLSWEYSEEAVEDARKVLEEATRAIESIGRKRSRPDATRSSHGIRCDL